MTATWSQMIAARAGSSDPAIVTVDGRRWTVDQLLDLASGAARWLDHAGAPPDAPVAALLPSHLTSFALLLAGASTSRPLAPLSPRFTEGELASCVERLTGDL